MFFVRAKEDAVWRTQLRQLVRCLVEARWAIDGQSVEVEPGLVVGFSEERDAEYFLTVHGRKEMPRCEIVHVVPGMIVAFHDETDAQYFVERNLGESVTEAEVIAMMQAAHNGEDPSVPATGDETHDEPTPVAADDAVAPKKVKKSTKH